MALKKQKQFVNDVRTIVSEGAKVRSLKGKVRDRQATVRSMRGTGGGVLNNSATAAGVIAETMNGKPKRKKP